MRRYWKAWLGFVMAFGVYYYFALPENLFNDPYSTVLEASNGELLCASIADDGQWRFPETHGVPEKYAEAVVAFEDKRFWSHPGADVLSMGRALRQNFAAGKVVSGGSTITMQVIRLSRKNKSRTIFEKAFELLLATRLELRYSKDQILARYASHAPFGGNVVGLDAACWRYFGTDARDLSWAQAALLAVLPNSPALIHPGKNRVELKAKRDRLLDKLHTTGKIDEFTCALSKEEPIPDEPHALPRIARHVLQRMRKDGMAGKKLTSTINYNLQHRTEQVLAGYHERMAANKIYNGAVLVLDVNTGNVLAYAGNVTSAESHENEVDVIAAPRSTGSILKPFLYAAMLDEGKILPRTLQPDVPLLINGFAPKNFSHQYDGAVHANQALIRSLNVPAVNMLRDFRYEKFHTLLSNLGMTSLRHTPDHYGLSLVLGGAEGTLWDIAGMYASMGRTLNRYFAFPGKKRYLKNDWHAPRYAASADTAKAAPELSSWLSAASIYLTFDALKEVYRPGEESGWRHFSSARKIAWKTGTSFGFRDAWAVGVTPDHVVGVWIGNADGEGRPGLTGTDAAAPLMFEIFAQLPGQSWFHQPNTELATVATCRKSGHRATANCAELDTILIATSGLISSPCPYHKMLHLTRDLKFQVHSECADMKDIHHRNWFVLPPVQEFYYRERNISYRAAPPFRRDCQPVSALTVAMDMIYPRHNARIFIPRELDGKPGSSVFELAHSNPRATVFWHLDGEYIGSTRQVHHMALQPREGKHILTLIDEQGEALERHFEVLSSISAKGL